MHRVATLALLISYLGIMSRSHSQSVEHSIVAKSGDAFGSLPIGTSLTGLFDATVLNGSGDCLFLARLGGQSVTSANNAVFLAGPVGQLEVLARRGDQAPGLRVGARLNFDYFAWTPVLTDSGTVVFSSPIANLGGDPAEDSAIYSGNPEALTAIAYSGAWAPTYWDHYFDTLSYPNANSIGEAAFKGKVVPPGEPGSYREGLYVGQPGRYRAALTTEDVAPHLPNYLVNYISTDTSIDRFGRVAFTVGLRGDDVNYINSQALYFGWPDQLSLVMRSGVTQVPGMPLGTVWFPITNAELNDFGTIAFTGFARSADVSVYQDQGIWVGQFGSLQLIAREGSAAEGLPIGWTLGSSSVSNYPFNGPVLDNSGNVYFGAPASAAGDPESVAGPWLFVASAQASAPPRLILGGIKQPVNMGTGAYVASAQLIACNDNGMVLAYATFAGHRIGDSNNSGLVVAHRSGWSIVVAHRAELFTVPPGATHHIEDIHIETFQGPGQGGEVGGHDGRPRVFNNSGHVVFVADFDDGTSAVVRSQVFCPADFNQDALTDFFDYLDFVTAFAASAPSADFNRDFIVDFFDYLDFVASFSEGC